MDSNFINIELEKIDDTIDLEVFSDEHFGDPKRDIDLCNKRLKAVLDDPLRYTAFGGDQWNNIMPWDKRYTLESSDPVPSLTKEIQEWEEHHKPLFNINQQLIEKGHIGVWSDVLKADGDGWTADYFIESYKGETQ